MAQNGEIGIININVYATFFGDFPVSARFTGKGGQERAMSLLD